MSKQTNTKRDFWSCDFETTTPDSNYFKQTNDVCICLAGAVYSEDLSKRCKSTSFLGLLDEICKLDDSPYIRLTFHNLGNFDGSYILAELDEKGWDITTLGFKKGNAVRLFANDDGSIYELNLIYNKRHFNVVDSYKQLNLSVASLGQAQGLQKLEVEYTFEPFPSADDYTAEQIDYLYRDCEIIIEPMKNVYRMFANPKLTAGSTAVQGLYDHLDKQKAQQNSYQKRLDMETEQLFNYFTQTTYENAINMLPFCFGGLTFYNRLYRNCEVREMYCYDANSFYPTQMIKPMIIGSSMREEDVDYVTKEGEVSLLKIQVISAKLKGQKDFFFLRNFANQNKRMQAEERDLYSPRFVDKIEQPTMMYLFECEFNELQNWYDFDYVIIQRLVYETCDYMREYVQWMYDERKALKAKKDLRELTIKTNLNANFGKYMQNPVKMSMVYVRKGEGAFGLVTGGMKLIKPKDVKFNFKHHEAWIAIPTNEKPLVRNPIIGAYITALARSEIMRIVRKYRDRVIYGDTDSIFVKGKIPEFENTPNELGYWKNEFPNKPEGFTMYVYGRKRYICWDDIEEAIIKMGMCGVNKKLFQKFIEANVELKKEELDALLNTKIKGVKLAKDTVNGKRVLREIDYEIRRTKE